MQQLMLKTSVVNGGHFSIPVSAIDHMEDVKRDRTLIHLKPSKHTKYGSRVTVHGKFKELVKRWTKLKALQFNNGEGESPKEAKVDTRQVESKGMGFHMKSAANLTGPGIVVGHPGMTITSRQRKENARLHRLAKQGFTVAKDADGAFRKQPVDVATGPQPCEDDAAVSGVAKRMSGWLRRQPVAEVKVPGIDTPVERRTRTVGFDEKMSLIEMAPLLPSDPKPAPKVDDEFERVRYVRQPADFALPLELEGLATTGRPVAEVDAPNAVVPVEMQADGPPVDYEEQWLEALMNEDWTAARGVVDAVLRETGTWAAKRKALQSVRDKRETLTRMVREYQADLRRLDEDVARLEDDMKDMSDTDVAQWEKRQKIVAAALA